MRLRPYLAADAEPLLTIFRKNVPVAFAQFEVEAYATFVCTNNDPYCVVEQAGQVLGACGYYRVRDGVVARICWILADPDGRGSGVGSTLMWHVLNQIATHPGVTLIECETSQVAYPFFEKFGFVLQETKVNHWAPGLDLYFMTLNPGPARTTSA